VKQTFPDVIETQRLVLRCYQSGDALGILELVQQNRLQLVREFAQMAGLQNLEEARLLVAEKREHWSVGKSFCYGIWRKHPNEQIGQIQVKNVAWEIPSAELGYFISNSSQRQGYASESIKGILELAFQGLEFQRIFVRVLSSNRGSFSLAKRLGFLEEGLHRKSFRSGLGELHDVHYLALTNDDFSAQPAQLTPESEILKSSNPVPVRKP
jgi:RimJ/RimL family protein N-acetyltransferase